jgi:hypothetical protein
VVPETVPPGDYNVTVMCLDEADIPILELSRTVIVFRSEANAKRMEGLVTLVLGIVLLPLGPLAFTILKLFHLDIEIFKHLALFFTFGSVVIVVASLFTMITGYLVVSQGIMLR